MRVPVLCLQAKIVYCVHSGVSSLRSLTHSALYSSRHIVFVYTKSPGYDSLKVKVKKAVIWVLYIIYMYSHSIYKCTLCH